MEYRAFQREHPEWPVRLRDAMGRQVRLLDVLTTKGGAMFNPGEILVVADHHRGSLSLKDAKKAGRSIRGVSLDEVELLPKGDSVSGCREDRDGPCYSV